MSTQQRKCNAEIAEITTNAEIANAEAATLELAATEVAALSWQPLNSQRRNAGKLLSSFLSPTRPSAAIFFSSLIGFFFRAFCVFSSAVFAACFIFWRSCDLFFVLLFSWRFGFFIVSPSVFYVLLVFEFLYTEQGKTKLKQ